MENINVLFEVPYGSKLYGTSTPTSDTDNKVVYLPPLSSALAGNGGKIFKLRFDANGEKLGSNDLMPDNGVETEYFPFARFVRDFVEGQTYAVEVAFALLSGPEHELKSLVKEMVVNFRNSAVYSMVGFAVKQTFDYVRRGERLNAAKHVLEAALQVESLGMILVDQNASGPKSLRNARLDTPYNGGTLFDVFMERAAPHVKEGEVENNGKLFRSVELNGRSYLETTPLRDLVPVLQRLVKSYGDRSVSASESDVDPKSLSHAVRVYRQALELLETGEVTFPRPDAEYLLRVKKLQVPLPEVFELLRNLDDEVRVKMETSTLPQLTDELKAEAEVWLEQQLLKLYKLQVVA